MHLMTLRDVCLKNWKISSCGAGVSFTMSLKLIADTDAWWNWATTNHQISIYRFIAKKEKPSCAAAMPCLWCWFASDLDALLEKNKLRKTHAKIQLNTGKHDSFMHENFYKPMPRRGVRSCAPAKPCHCWSRLNRLELDGEGQNSSRSEWNRYLCWISRDTRPFVWIFGYFLKLTARFASSQLTLDFATKKMECTISSREVQEFLRWSNSLHLSWQVVRLSGEKHSDKMEEANRWVNWLFLDILLNQQ